MGVFRCVYVSRVARNVRYEHAELIAERSAKKNEVRALSGMLLYTPTHFLQVLEGDEAQVYAAIAAIERDPRHSELRVLEAREVPKREFGEWSMVARQLTRQNTALLAELDAERALELLRDLR